MTLGLFLWVLSFGGDFFFGMVTFLIRKWAFQEVSFERDVGDAVPYTRLYEHLP